MKRPKRGEYALQALIDLGIGSELGEQCHYTPFLIARGKAKKVLASLLI
jgi:hypothetical protein